MRRNGLIIMAVGTLMCSVPCGFSQECKKSEVTAAIKALRTMPAVDPVYIEDGAADGSIVMLPPSYEPPSIVKLLIKCPAAAAPELISCLDDQRLSQVLCKTSKTGDEPRRVPVGYLCLDLLLVLVEPGIVTDSVCEDDGLGACVHDGYYFRPDDYDVSGDEVQAQPVVRRVKEAWLELLRSQRVRFAYPDWLDDK